MKTRFPHISMEALIRHPELIFKLGQGRRHRRHACKGSCGRLVYGVYCRKCRRRIAREWKRR